MEECGKFLCPKCGHNFTYKSWIKINNKWIFSITYSDEERWTNAELEQTRSNKLKSYQEKIDDINSQFMTLSASDRAEDCEPWEDAINEVHNNYEAYYKASPKGLEGSTIEAWDKFSDYDWECYKCDFTSPTFLDFIPKK